MIIVANGFLATKNELFDHICVAIYCASIHTSMVIVVVQFFCRYQKVCRADDSKRSSLIWQFAVVAVLYCVTQATDATFTFVIGATEEIRQLALEIMHENYGMTFANDAAPYPMMSHYTEWKSIIHHFFYLASSAGGYTLVIWCQSQIISFTSQHGSSYRASTRRLNQDVNRALVALAITPLISLMGPSFFYITQIMLDIRNPCTAFLSLFMSLITLVNPVTTIFFVRPYRNAVMNVLCLGKRRQVVPSNAVSTMPVSSIGGGVTRFVA
ncbi:CRE-STR-90 protein [Aphelenchoides avenae]|nr:CRE-STR-90 protein [Aphelenchus avenae]